jgi:hypothetical protein
MHKKSHRGTFVSFGKIKFQFASSKGIKTVGKVSALRWHGSLLDGTFFPRRLRNVVGFCEHQEINFT